MSGNQRISAAVFVILTFLPAGMAFGQESAPTTVQQPALSQPALSQPAPAVSAEVPADRRTISLAPGVALGASPAPQPLFDFKDADIKFNLGRLMNVLRDNRHEGWVLAAYPDPKTSRPLIGAGFSLDVTTTEHPQRDPLNPHPFFEPSSAQLWQAAGLDSSQLQSILEQYDRQMESWQKKKYRKKIRTHELSPQLTEEEATQLLRISAIQATYNARAYCRFFDQLTASQQMALSQLVFQMGVNLEEFTQFLSAINQEAGYGELSQTTGDPASQIAHWKMVQTTLMQSQWARRYTDRAVSVIAMFDPNYENDPMQAEREVRAVLRPPAHHRKKAHVKSASDVHRAGKSSAGKSHSTGQS